MNGISIAFPDENGMDILLPGLDGIDIAGGNTTGRGIYIHDYSGIGDPDTGIVIRQTAGHGIFIDSVGYGMFGADGINITHTGGAGIDMRNIGVNGIYIKNVGDDGVEVTGTVPGDCFNCNPTGSFLFRVSNKGDIYGHNHFSYIVDDMGKGKTVPIPRSTKSTVEHTDKANLAGKTTLIDLPGDFMEITTIDKDNPLSVFITPTSPIGEYWVEERKDGFVLHAEKAEGSFNYRVIATTKGSENVGIEEISIDDYSE